LRNFAICPILKKYTISEAELIRMRWREYIARIGEWEYTCTNL